MDRQAVLVKTRKELRSVLISAPRGVPARMLLKDYKMVTGKELPYRQLGFNTLEDFIHAQSDVVRIGLGPTGEPTFYGVANAETAQISRFVASQKKTKLKKSLAPPPVVARTPMKMAAFTKKFRYGPRSSPRGGANHRIGRAGPPLLFPPPSSLRHLTFHPPLLPEPLHRAPPPPLLPEPLHRAPPPPLLSEPLHRAPPPPLLPEPLHRAPPPPPLLPEPLHRAPPPPLLPEPLHRAPPPPLLPEPLHRAPPPSLLSEPLHRTPPLTDPYLAQSIALLCCDIHELPPPLLVRQYPRSPSSPGSYNMQPPKANFPPRFHAHREVYPSGTFSYSRSSTAQNFHVHVPNPQPSSSSFHHSSSLQDLEGRKSPPRQRLGSLPTDISSPPRTASGIPPWKKEFEKATEVTIQQLHGKINLNFNQTVCMTGYSSGKHLEETTKDGTLSRKFLLFSQYKKGKPQLPAVMLYFRQPFWDIREYPDPLHLGEGVRLKVYGGPFVQYSKKKGVGEPACTVKFYEKLSGAVRSASSSVSDSAHTSPRGSRSTSPKSVMESSGRPQSLDIKSGSLEDKVYKLLKGFPQGLWGKRLGKEFEMKYHQPAPPDLLHRAKIMPFVKWDEIVEDTPILYPKREYYQSEQKEEPEPKPQDKPQPKLTETVTLTSPSSWIPKERATSTRREQTPSQSSCTSPSSNPSHIVHAQLPSQPVRPSPPLLPSTVEFAASDEIFDVYVCHVNSPVSFYVQVLGNDGSERFLAMEERLNKHYSSPAEPATSVSVNHLYGYCWEEDEEEADLQWCRALVVAVRKNEADVMFPDYGNSETVSCHKLKQLPERFHTLPFQAIHCCLHGITESDEEACKKFSELAVGKVCVTNIMDRSGSRVSIELIVSESECQETINSLLMKDLHPLSTLTPQLPTPGSPLVPVTLTDVDEDGVISIQLMGPGLNRLQQLMNEINDAYSKPKSKASDFVSKVSEGMAACAKFSVDGSWYRIVVKKILESKKLLVEYVDYGNEEELDKIKLRKALDTELYSLPHQAVKCSLYGLPPPQGEWTEDGMGTVAEYVECEDIQLEVIESPTDHCLAAVRLFVKSGEEIVSLNDMLLAQPSLFRLSDPNMGEVSIEEEEEGFTYGSVDTSPVSSSHSSRVSDGAFEEPLVISQGGPLLTAKEPGNQVTKESVNKDIYEKFGQLSLQEERKCLLGDARTQSGIAETASPAEAMFDRHSPPANLTSTRDTAHEIIPPLSSVSVSHVPEVVEQRSDSISVEVGPITPVTSTSDLEARYSASLHTPMFSPPGLSTSIEPKLSSNRSSSYLQPYTPSNSPSPCSSPLHRGGGGMKFESLTPLKHVAVTVSWAASPEDFVVQLLSRLDELEQMMVKLNMSVMGQPGLSSTDIVSGLLCCASSIIDKRWYRAVVISAHDGSGGGNITVEFLDYGGRELVSLASVKALPGNFLELPFQGIHCSLKGVSPSGGPWSSAAFNYFNQRVVGYQLYAIEHNREPSTSVVFLLDTSVIPNIVINDEIVEKQLAVRDNSS